MKTFKVCFYDKKEARVVTQHVEAESIQDAKDEVENGFAEIVSISQVNARAQIVATRDHRKPALNLKISELANWKKELATESAMLGENE